MSALFPLGRIVATPGALRVLEESKDDAAFFVRRHMLGDWGEMDPEDTAANNAAVINGTRLMSAYRTTLGEKLWIITEWDRSATTILLPEEY